MSACIYDIIYCCILLDIQLEKKFKAKERVFNSEGRHETDCMYEDVLKDLSSQRPQVAMAENIAYGFTPEQVD